MGERDSSRRASQAKLVGAGRDFELVGTQTWVTVWAAPYVSAEDAQDALDAWQRPWLDPNALTQVDIEVAPPAVAGEHARASLVNTTYETAPRHSRVGVAWHDGQAMVYEVRVIAPTEYNLLDAMSTLIKLQRARCQAAGL
jgi:hypothetical protein